jgi:hypothetical protein
VSEIQNLFVDIPQPLRSTQPLPNRKDAESTTTSGCPRKGSRSDGGGCCCSYCWRVGVYSGTTILRSKSRRCQEEKEQEEVDAVEGLCLQAGLPPSFEILIVAARLGRQMSAGLHRSSPRRHGKGRWQANVTRDRKIDDRKRSVEGDCNNTIRRSLFGTHIDVSVPRHLAQFNLLSDIHRYASATIQI